MLRTVELLIVLLGLAIVVGGAMTLSECSPVRGMGSSLGR
jgi:hypothetical protein